MIFPTYVMAPQNSRLHFKRVSIDIEFDVPALVYVTNGFILWQSWNPTWGIYLYMPYDDRGFTAG
jgi:hypothetical protein